MLLLQVHPGDREVKREDALKRRSANLSDSTTSYRGNKSTVSRPVHLPLGIRYTSDTSLHCNEYSVNLTMMLGRTRESEVACLGEGR